MSDITERASADRVPSGLDHDRDENRLTGWIIAVSASILLWVGLGGAIWAVISLFG